MTTLRTLSTAAQIAAVTWLFVETGQYIQEHILIAPIDTFWWLWSAGWIIVILVLYIVDLRNSPRR